MLLSTCGTFYSTTYQRPYIIQVGVNLAGMGTIRPHRPTVDQGRVEGVGEECLFSMWMLLFRCKGCEGCEYRP